MKDRVERSRGMRYFSGEGAGSAMGLQGEQADKVVLQAARSAHSDRHKDDGI
jgi:hypothetical protein